MMSYGQKKFKTPLELHKTLRNDYQVSVAQRHEFRRKMKLELKAEARHNQILQRKLEDQQNAQEQQQQRQPQSIFDSAMAHRQLQLELEIERLRSTIETMNHTSPKTAPARSNNSPTYALPQSATSPTGGKNSETASARAFLKDSDVDEIMDERLNESESVEPQLNPSRASLTDTAAAESHGVSSPRGDSDSNSSVPRSSSHREDAKSTMTTASHPATTATTAVEADAVEQYVRAGATDTTDNDSAPPPETHALTEGKQTSKKERQHRHHHSKRHHSRRHRSRRRHRNDDGDDDDRSDGSAGSSRSADRSGNPSRAASSNAPERAQSTNLNADNAAVVMTPALPAVSSVPAPAAATAAAAIERSTDRSADGPAEDHTSTRIRAQQWKLNQQQQHQHQQQYQQHRYHQHAASASDGLEPIGHHGASHQRRSNNQQGDLKDSSFAALMLSPYFDRDPSLSITQSREHNHAGSAPPLLSMPNILPINTNRAKSGGMFVLPCAPNLGVSNMLQLQERSIMDNSGEIGHWNAFTPMRQADGDTASLGSGQSMVLPSHQQHQQQLSLEEQICRFAEIQSLFTQPSELSEDETQLLQRLHLQSLRSDGVLGSPLQRQGRVLTTIDIKHDQQVEEKRQKAFLNHKMRHERARNPPRRFPLEAPTVNKMMPASSKSPRARIHQIRYPQYTSESEYFRTSPNPHMQGSTVDFAATTNDDGAVATVKSIDSALAAVDSSACSSWEAAEGDNRSENHPAGNNRSNHSTPTPSAGGLQVDTASTRSDKQSSSKKRSLRSPKSVKPPWLQSNKSISIMEESSDQGEEGDVENEHRPATNKSSRNKSSRSSRNRDSASSGDERQSTAAASAASAAAAAAASAASAAAAVAKTGAAVGQDAAPKRSEGGSNAPNAGVEGAADQQGETQQEMSLQEFKVAHNRLAKKMGKVVQQAVVEELKEDCNSQHFTKTKQQQLLAKKKKPLANRIEKKLNDKLQELQKELVALRASKVNVVKDRRRRRGSGGKDHTDDDDDDDDDSGVERDDDARNHGDGWHKNNELDQKKSKIDPASIAINLDLKHNVEELLRGEGTPPREGMTPLSGPRTGATSALDPPHPSDSDAEKADLLANVLASALAEEGEAEVKPKKKKLTKAEKLMGFTEDGPPPAMDRPPANTSETTSRLFGLFGKNSSESRKLGVPSGSKKSNPTKGGKGRNFGLKSIADDDEASFHSMDSKASKGSRRTGKKKRGNGSDAEARMQSLAYGGARADSTTNLSTGALSGKDADLRRLEAELGNETDNLAILIDNKNKIKKELKDWETNFQRRVGRPPNDADKTAIEERFLAYRTASHQVKSAAQVVKALEQKLRDTKS